MQRNRGKLGKTIVLQKSKEVSRRKEDGQEYQMLQKCQVGLEWRRGSFLKIRTEHFITFKIIQLTCEQCRSWGAHNPLSSSAENPHMICSCPPYTWLLCIHGSISSTSCSVVFTTEKNVHKTGLVQLLDPVVQESTVMAK